MPRELPVVQFPGTEEPPLFERIGIVGLGLIGGSIALRARRVWPRALVIGVDSHDVLEKAMLLHAIDVAATDLTIIGGAQLVVFAMPIGAIIERLGELPAFLAGPAVVTDVGSTKREICEAAASLPERLVFIGGHPMAGSAEHGVEHARADLFDGRRWLLVPPRASGNGGSLSATAVGQVEQFVRAMGAEPSMIGADDHDRLMAALSHLPQMAATVLMDVVGERAGERLDLAGDGLKDTTRLAASSIEIWRDICATNRDALRAALLQYAKAIGAAADALEDRDALDDLFSRAHAWRRRLEE